MIRAQQFVEPARELGFDWYAGVPCSFLTPFINYTINDSGLSYISSANEGDALAVAAGAVIGGKRAVVMMQNSGLGNAVNPLTTLAHVFRIPVLVIVTLRGDPKLKDEPQHKLMGRITGVLLEAMEVPWEYFPDADDIEAALHRAQQYMARERRPYAFIMRKGAVTSYAQPPAWRKTVTPRAQPSLTSPFSRLSEECLSRTEALRRIVELTNETDTVVIATTGYTGRELFALADRPNHFYMVGSMGCASSLGLGLAMVRPDLRVVVIDGDGAALMRMGNFATLGAYGGPNLVHILLDNEVHDSTGGQATVSAGVAFAKIAEACGYPVALQGDDLSLLDTLFAGHPGSGPRFAHLKIRPGAPNDLPRPTLTPAEVCRRLMSHIGSEPGAPAKAQAIMTQ